MDKKRPGIITLICILGFIGALVSIPLAFSDVAQGIRSWYPLFLSLSAIVGLIAMVGLWKMKKWSVVLYTALTGINQVILLAIDTWNVAGLLIPGVVIAIMVSQYAKMD